MKKNITIGSWITLNHPSVCEILADSGFDWLCIDLEHSAIDFFETQNLISIIQLKGLKAYVRVGENNNLIIKRVLDAGADGIIVPMVNNTDDVKKAVDSLKYPPLGKRGVGLSRAQNYGFGFENYKNNVSDKIKLIVQIEHIDAINNLDAILSNKFVDGSIIGPYDLSASMGKPGKYNDKDVKEVLSKYEVIAKKYNKMIGFHVIEPDYKIVQEKINKGYDFIAFSLDTIFLGSLPRNEIKKIKSMLSN